MSLTIENQRITDIFAPDGKGNKLSIEKVYKGKRQDGSPQLVWQKDYGIFVASCSHSPYLMYSTDYCNTWQAAEYPDISPSPIIIQLANYDNRFYCFFRNRLMTSSTGKKWIDVLFSENADNITSFLVTVDSNRKKTYIVTTATDDTSYIKTYVTNDLYSDWISYQTDLAKTGAGLAWMTEVNGQVYALRRKSGTDYGAIYKFDSESCTWEKIYDPSYSLDCLHYGNGKLIAVGIRNVVYSDNGSNWSTATLPYPSDQQVPTSGSAKVISHNGKFYVFRHFSSIKRRTCVVSEDCKNWTQLWQQDSDVPGLLQAHAYGNIVVNSALASNKKCLAYVTQNNGNDKIAFSLDNCVTWAKSTSIPSTIPSIVSVYAIAVGKARKSDSGIFVYNSLARLLNATELFKVQNIAFVTDSKFYNKWYEPSTASTINVDNTKDMYEELGSTYFDNTQPVTGGSPKAYAFMIELIAMKKMSISIGSTNRTYQMAKRTDEDPFICVQNRYKTFLQDDINRNAPYNHRTCVYCDNASINASIDKKYDFTQTIESGTKLTFYFYETYDRDKGDIYPHEDMDIRKENIDYSFRYLQLTVKVN